MPANKTLRVDTNARSVLTRFLILIWTRDRISKDWYESVIVLIYEKIDRSWRKNHGENSLVSIASKLLMDIILCRLPTTRASCAPENRAGFQPGRGCVNRTFTLRQISNHGLTFCRPNYLCLSSFARGIRISRPYSSLALPRTERCGRVISFSFSNRYVQTIKADFVLVGIFRCNSGQEVMFLMVTPFHLCFPSLPLRFKRKSPCHPVRIVHCNLTRQETV